MGAYWIPQYKYQLVEWLNTYYYATKSIFPTNFSRMRKKQLLAIYINIRKKGGLINETVTNTMSSSNLTITGDGFCSRPKGCAGRFDHLG